MATPATIEKTRSSGWLSNLIHLVKELAKSMKATLPYLMGWTENHKEVTEEYPDRISARMPEDLPIRFRGILNNDISNCSGCKNCVSACPIDCIRLETEPGPEKNVSWVAVYDIDIAKCMFCGLCVESCPTGSLQHTRQYEGAVLHLRDMVYSFGRGWATSEMKEKWQSEQISKEAVDLERAKTRLSPVGSEFKRLLKEKKE